jgi:hypothetical protein
LPDFGVVAPADFPPAAAAAARGAGSGAGSLLDCSAAARSKKKKDCFQAVLWNFYFYA